jgi:hypothetical protein
MRQVIAANDGLDRSAASHLTLILGISRAASGHCATVNDDGCH